ncbi:LigA [Parafrankia sp. EUN1f]|nr:LigA [Parafrankia sp. EUN1f]
MRPLERVYTTAGVREHRAAAPRGGPRPARQLSRGRQARPGWNGRGLSRPGAGRHRRRHQGDPARARVPPGVPGPFRPGSRKRPQSSPFHHRGGPRRGSGWPTAVSGDGIRRRPHAVAACHGTRADAAGRPRTAGGQRRHRAVGHPRRRNRAPRPHARERPALPGRAESDRFRARPRVRHGQRPVPQRQAGDRHPRLHVTGADPRPAHHGGGRHLRLGLDHRLRRHRAAPVRAGAGRGRAVPDRERAAAAGGRDR